MEVLDFKTELFTKRVHDSLNTVQRILDLHRHPRLAEDVDHEYGDKYRLIEQMANTALIAQFNVLTYFGLTSDVLHSIDQSKPTTIRFQASTSCTYLKEETVEVPSQKIEEIEEHVESSLLGSTNRSTIKQVVHHVTEYHWKVDVEWEVSLYSCSDVEERMTLKRRSSSMLLVIQSNKQAPSPKHKEYNPVDLSLNLLLKFVNTKQMVSTFAIDRDAPATKTPCQNEEVSSVVKMMNQLEGWTKQVRNFFVVNVLVEHQRKHNPVGSAAVLDSQANTWSLPVLEELSPNRRTPEQKARDVEDILNWKRNPKEHDNPETEAFKKVDQLLPEKPGQAPLGRANDIDNVLTWLRKRDMDELKFICANEPYRPTKMIEGPDIRTPTEKARDIENITNWVRNPKLNMRPETEPFKKIDQLLPKKPGQTAEDRAKDIDSALTWVRNRGVDHPVLHEGIFVPVLPVMETLQTLQMATTDTSSDNASTSNLTLAVPTVTENSSPSTPILSTHDMHTLLNEQVRSIEERIASLHKMYPSSESTTAWSVEEVTLVVLCPYSRTIGERFVDAVNYVESVLRNQLVAAIGKHIQLSDIEQYVHYHNVRLLNSPPKSFCHPIRLLGHDPYGLLSIESTNADGTRKPIQTLCREIKSSNSSTVKVPLNSAATVELSGQVYLHGWINHRFGQSKGSFDLIARARQFSAFLLVVGTMSGSDQLNPKDAIIVQNKDEVLIPLILDEIPTSKEFKDAIHSLSPEQQRFAKAFRSMQLASSVLGICVIQIKPQLEVLLGLGEGALTKEMQLTQDLMELFIEYQIPSDLVSYDGNDPRASRNERVSNVRGHVKSVFDVIHTTKGTEIQEKLTEGLARQLEVDPGSMIYDRPGDVRGGLGNPMSHEVYHKYSDMARDRAFPFRPTKGGSFGREWYETDEDEVLNWDRDLKPPSSDRIFHMSHSTSAHPQNYNNKQANTQEQADNALRNIDLNVSTLPQLLNSAIEATSLNIALRSTTIKLNNQWRRNRQADLLSKPVPSTLDVLDGSIKTETNKAFDLLDALSRSGTLSIAFSEVHVLVAVTHSFEKDVIETIVQDNINPLEKLEMSALLVGSVIHDVPVSNLVRDKGALARWTNFV